MLPVTVPPHASIVVVGAGVAGTSIAYHLAKRGQTDVVVLDARRIGSGSTSKAAGGIRQQFSTEVNIRLSLLSLAFWHRFDEEMGSPIDFHQIGYLFLARDEDELATLRKNVELQNRFGVPSRIISPREVSELVPHLRVDDLVGASYCATDGYAGPYEATMAFAREAKRRGARIFEETPVTAIEVNDGRVQAVQTPVGRIVTPVVVNAAGAYAGKVGELVGVHVPVQPIRRHIFVSAPFPTIDYVMPLTVDMAGNFYFRREGPCILIGGGEDEELRGFDDSVDWNCFAEVARKVTVRLPILEQATFPRAWAGLREVTPDQHALLGPVSGLEGFYCACGFSGHGFMHAPATGQLMAELLLDGRTSLDISRLDPSRFAAPPEASFYSGKFLSGE